MSRRFTEEDSNSVFDSAEWADRGRLRYTDDDERLAKARADEAEEARQRALRANEEHLAALQLRLRQGR